MGLTKFEAFSKIAHRVSVSEEERNALTETFLAEFGTDEEKKRLYSESAEDKAKRETKERFDAAVADEVKKHQDVAAEQAAIKAAADAQKPAQVPA